MHRTGDYPKSIMTLRCEHALATSIFLPELFKPQGGLRKPRYICMLSQRSSRSVYPIPAFISAPLHKQTSTSNPPHLHVGAHASTSSPLMDTFVSQALRLLRGKKGKYSVTRGVSPRRPKTTRRSTIDARFLSISLKSSLSFPPKNMW